MATTNTTNTTNTNIIVKKEDELIGNKYKLLEHIGLGSFGSIYKGINVRTKEHVAIKVESVEQNTKLLKNESIIYQYLLNNTGIPNVKWFGKDEINYYMVLNLLGESLESLKEKKGGFFSLKLTLQIGLQIIYLLKTIHNKGLVHRDIKPDNFLLGLDNKNKQLHIIDFGFCKSFLDNNNHIVMKKTSNLIGSNNYASINSHNHLELSRRDDLESLGFILIYLYLGKLPWYNLENNNNNKGLSTEEINKLFIISKTDIFNNKKIPDVFVHYLRYIRSLEFEEKPNYYIILDSFKREIDEL